MTDRSIDPPAGVAVREATADEVAAVLGVLDAAALETDAERVRQSVEDGGTLVAVSDGGTDGDGRADGDDGGDTGTLVGALVLEGEEIASVAVRRRRRGQGIGRALVAAAAGRRDRLVAEFDACVRPFYERLGFRIEPLGDDRFRGLLDRGADDRPDV